MRPSQVKPEPLWNGEKMVAERVTKVESDSTDRIGPSGRRTNDGLPPRLLGYVKKLVEKYDDNGNGTLEANEWTKMRNQPEVADTDKDGRITVVDYARWWMQR